MDVEAGEAVGGVVLQVNIDCGGSAGLDGLDGMGVDGRVSGDWDPRPRRMPTCAKSRS